MIPVVEKAYKVLVESENEGGGPEDIIKHLKTGLTAPEYAELESTNLNAILRSTTIGDLLRLAVSLK